MNTVCPGFVPHHVKPNRCRRCFKDALDHDSSKEVTTSFTLPLPRRRRESVAVTETPKAEETPSTDQSASYTMRTRQRSSSTSSWFQEKKVSDEQKEKIDSLFRNADDSKATYRSTDTNDDKSVDTVAVIRLPESRLRRRSDRDTLSDRTTSEKNESTIETNSKSSSKYNPGITLGAKLSSTVSSKFEDGKPPELPPKTLENRVDVPKKYDYRTLEKKETETTKPSASDLLSRTSSLRSRIETAEASKTESKYGTKTLGSDTLNRASSFRSQVESKTPETSKIDSKPDSSKTTTSDSLGASSSFRSKFETRTPETTKLDSKVPDKRSLESKFNEKKPIETKFGEVKLRDTKLSEIRSRASKFESATTNTKAAGSISKVSDTKSSKFSDLKSKSDKPDASKISDNKAKSDKEVVSSKTIESKEAPKPVLSRFPSFGASDTKPTTKPVIVSKKVSSSSSEEETESSEEETPPKPKTPAVPKEHDKKSVAPVTSKVTPKTLPVMEEITKDQVRMFSKTIESKEVPKPVLSRGPSFVASDTKPTTKPVIVSKKVSSSSSEEETESSEEEPPPKPKTPVIPKEPDKKLVSPVTSKATSKTLSVKEEITKDQVSMKQQKEYENKLKELQELLEQLKKQLKSKEDTVSKLEKDKSELQKKQQALLDKDKEALEKTALELTKMRTKLAEMQASQDDVKNENKKLKQESKDSNKELKQSKLELKEAKDELNKLKQELLKKQEPVLDKSKSTIEQLKAKLAQSEALCQELMEENEDIKKEVRDLEQELEELHDNFREDQASEFRGLKKELETATKNCRVLQFKLRKSEKKCELLELDRHSLEDKVREYQAAVRQDVDRSKFKELEKELSLARNLTTSLSKDVKELKEALVRAEAENDALRQVSGGGTRSVTPTSQSRLSPVVKDNILGKDYETLSHELSDTMERENDLREQLKFSEEEAKQARRKIGSLEQENETLVLQIKKLTNIMRNKKGGKYGDAEEEETSAENLKIQLDLLEQEMGVIRRKLDEAEKDNESLQSEVKYLQEKVINQPLIELPELPKDASSPGVYWENKVRLQEYEIRETRKKLIEKDREIERLNTEVEIYRKKASKVMVRSRSLDNDLQVDLKRQLQLVEQEASILRQKLNSLETENEKLASENKRMTLRLTKKPPPTSADILQMDNMELKQKLEDQQRKVEAMKEELQKTTADSPVAIIQDYKPRKESLTSLLSDNENDLIASLKRRLKAKDEEHQSLQSRTMQLEIESSRLNREYKKLKESLSSKKKPMKAIRDSATRVELRELVSELQDEISELHVTLRSREVVQEGLEEELDKVRKELKDSLKEAKQREERLQLTADKTKIENETLKKELDSQKSRASTAEVQLNQISKQSDSSLDQAKKINQLTLDKEDADRKAKAAEEALENKTQRLRDTQEKLNAVSSLKEDMARSNRLLESMKAELEKEVDEQRRLLVKADAKVAELKSQVDMTDRDLLSLKKECNQLRNELEEERSRLKQSSDKQQSEVNNSFIREREEYKRNINDLKNRIEQLQQQIIDNEKLFIEKESRLREEFKRKKESAVRDTREKGEAALELAREDEKILRNKAQELSDKLEKAEKSLRDASEKSRKVASEFRREKEEWHKERDNLESEIRTEVKKREKSERESEQMLSQKEEEVLLSKERVVAIEREQRRMQMQLEEVESLQQKLKLMEQDGDKMREEYNHLTARYDQLEDEFVKTKSKLIQEKEQAETNFSRVRKEHNELSFEMSSLKESYNSRQDAWIKEKLELQERVKELSRRLDKFKSAEQDKRRLQDLVEEKETLIESYKKEEKYLKEERNRLQKRIEDLAKAMEAKIDRPLVLPPVDTGDSKLDKQLETMRREYEGRMSIMSSEITSMQNQIASLVEERDRLKSQLSMAERNAEEMRTGSLKRERARHREEADSARRKVNELRYQVEDVREQLDDAVLENKNLKLQIETDKNSYDIQISEFKSKINQLEEQKIMESTRGQTRNIAKTRLELTWEKERNELQHLLGETQKMVSDLKSRVESTETEREKEKQAVRKQMLDMRSSTEKDHQDSRRKMSELHSSLLEIRESHAKLRGMYDRMKKEREILLKEREEWRQRLQAAMQLHTKLTEIVKDVEKVSSEVASNSEKSTLPLTDDFKETVRKVKDKFTELQKSAEILKEDERLKRTTSFRRAISAQDMSQSQDPMQRWNNPQRVTNYPVAPPSMIIRPPPRQKTLHRKSLSLDNSLMGTTHEQRLKIWESEGESVTSTPAGSLLSLGGYGYETDSSLPDSEYRYGGVTLDKRRYRAPSSMSGMTTDSEAPYSSREGSVDPGGSSESVPLATQQQRKTFKDKLKMLRRTKSIDVSTGQKLGSTGSGPDKKAKEDKQMSLRSKISKVLQKPLGRSLSLETKKPGPALPPKGVVPDVVPNRPTAEKPLSASRGELSSRKPSSQEEKRPKKKTGVETPV